MLWVVCSLVLLNTLQWVLLLFSLLQLLLQQVVLLLHSLQLSQQLLLQMAAQTIFHSKLNTVLENI